ncbi:MAG: type VI secretion system baseplate subunit TssE [Bilophila sp.]
MPGIRFLERLRATQSSPDSRDLDDAQDVLASVVAHIANILNTRQGSTLLDEELGIPDFTSMGMQFTNDDIPRIERSIALLLARYEPRLADVQVRLEPESNAASQMIFVLNARLNVSEIERLPVQLFTRVSPQGKVTVNQ